MYMCKHGCVSVHTHMCMWRSEVSLGCYSARKAQLVFWDSFSLSLGNHHIDKACWSASPRDLSSSPQDWDLTCLPLQLKFSLWVLGLNPDPCVSMWPTALSPYPSSLHLSSLPLPPSFSSPLPSLTRDLVCSPNWSCTQAPLSSVCRSLCPRLFLTKRAERLPATWEDSHGPSPYIDWAVTV